ncbi:MAG: CRISPR-associated endoribonuclease Cas6 [Ignavibacteriaceae bacterium]|nr:CRISPR-associated endoribonuclease Cas6 [Ignavibacteriaceae bacterium]
MRIHLKLRSEKKPVPFNYQPQITGAIHKWIGKNEIHDKTSMYSFSWLQGGKKRGDHLIFENGAIFEFSSYDNTLIKALIRGIQIDPIINFGLEVSELTLQEPPIFSPKEVFYVSSPILVKRKVEEKEIHYTYNNPECDILLTETLKTKLRKAGISDKNINVSFYRGYPMARTKIIYYNKIGNRVNICPVEIAGSPEQIAFAWNVGIGNSTGIGFGALK